MNPPGSSMMLPHVRRHQAGHRVWDSAPGGVKARLQGQRFGCWETWVLWVLGFIWRNSLGNMNSLGVSCRQQQQNIFNCSVIFRDLVRQSVLHIWQGWTRWWITNKIFLTMCMQCCVVYFIRNETLQVYCFCFHLLFLHDQLLCYLTTASVVFIHL